jgi:hypothetical protein
MRLDSKKMVLAPLALRAGDPRKWVPPVLMAMLVANVVAGWFVWQTPGGSAGDLADQISTSQTQVQRTAANLGRLRALVRKVETARNEQQKFVSRYFMDRRTASSTILTELGQAASRAGLTPKEHAFIFEPIEGSDTFTMMTIAANYEGRYSDLRQFIGSLDRSERFLIIEDVTAAPQQEPGKLSARFKINAFVREGGPATLPKAGLPLAPKAQTGPVASDGKNASLELAEKR